MTHRDLRPVPLSEVLPLRVGGLYITMAEGQWDETLAAAYEAGWTLLEVDAGERPVRAYQRKAALPERSTGSRSTGPAGGA